MTIERFKQLLEINPQDEQSILKYFQPLETIEQKFSEVLEDISIDKWRPLDRDHRPDRSTGVAVLIGVIRSIIKQQQQHIFYLYSCIYIHTYMYINVMIYLCIKGPGKVVELKYANHIRQYRDLEKGSAPLFDNAVKYYTDLGNHAVSNKHVIDLFACCLDQTGVAEQRTLVDHTGGVLVLSDTFRTSVFQESFSSLFMCNATEELSMCFDAEIKVRTSRQIKVNACLGPVTRITEKVKSNSVSNNTNEIGIGGTSKWSIGGIFPSTTFCFVFDIASNMTADDTTDAAYIQFQTTYKTSYGTNVTRVTTIGVALANINKTDGFNKVCENMDNDAVTVVMARWAIHKADTEFMCPLMNWLDREIIKFCRKVSTSQKNNVESFRMPNSLVKFPEAMYYLRRSQFIHPNDYSLDESAFFKCSLMRENIVNTMAMVQPLLYCYTLEDETMTPVNVELEYSSRHSDVILLLDSFFHLVIW
ncbi:hypothetical protein RFI_08015 [Reticulomyxa filosa]|uniref:Protein transport protein SEC23 n=1 Tax=Reticulomyxa filosa TaxID=46433 RepID=X6NTL9_RETFI|nr:hypothetical protein RFI_08015 [Reticulomyxa filosa]|eukprot:ETO29109.1 hypothetical protein RFI_08015 [Reticulomyxa filosa]